MNIPGKILKIESYKNVDKKEAGRILQIL